MGIKTRLRIYLAATFVLIFGAVTLSIEFGMLPHFLLLERELLQEKLLIAKNLLDRRLDSLDAVLKDYANWNDLHAFASGNADEEPLVNLLPSDHLEICFMAVVTEGGARVLVVAPEHTALRDAIVGADNAIADACASQDSMRGMLGAAGVGYVVAARPIHQTGGAGESAGCLIMARALDATVLDSIGTLLGVECALTFSSTPAAGTPQPTVSEGADTVSASVALPTLGGAPGNLSVAADRSMVNTADTQVWRVVGVAVVFALITMIAYSIVIDRQLIRRLVRLDALVRRLDDLDAIPRDETFSGSDEVTRLSDGLNELLLRGRLLLSQSEQARQELAEREQLFRAIFEASPVAMVINKLNDFTFLSANPEFLHRYGKPLEQILGKTPDEVGLSTPANAMHAARQTVLDQGSTRNVIMNVTGPDGRERVTLSSTVAISWNGESCALTASVDVTELTRLREALANSEEMLQLIVEQTGHAVYDYDIASGQIRWSGALLDLVGYSPEEFPARDIAAWEDLIHPDDREDAIGLLSMATSANSRLNIVYRFQRKDGSYVAVEDIGQVMSDDEGHAVRMVGVMRDVSDRVRAEQALHASEERFRMLFNTASDGIMLLKDGIFVDCNMQCCAMFGQSREEIVGQSPVRFSPERQPDGEISETAARKRLTAVQEGEAQVFEWQHLHGSGEPFDAEVKLNSVSIGGEVYVQALVRDVTERKRVEDRLRQAQKMEAVGLLAGGVAHDFNNLLQAITSCGQLLLLKDAVNEHGRSLVEDMLAASERAANLTRQLLTFSRRQVIDPKPQNMNEVVQNLARMLRRLLGEHVVLSVRTDQRLPLVRADRGQLEQVIINLCINARDAMPEGGRLVVACEVVEASERVAAAGGPATGRHVCVSVSDTGNGMNPETLAHAFEPFYTTKEQGQGTGLGLATVHGIIQQHHGVIAIESHPGQGTCFRFWLPAIDQAPAETSTLEAGLLEGGNGTILLAEDEEHVRKLTREILETAGYQVLTATNGVEALQLYRKTPHAIDLLLLDVVMPYKSGPAVYKELLAEGSTVPCIFASGYSEDEVHMGFVVMDGVELLQKPYTLSELLSRVRAVLDKKSA